ncbi:hypothetical protein DL98DRAFT_651951 [Cadophora sp. DSE1049]|nr:hypothetical protein DL98DRAFT_651951 [Cadophora sp. DSE1049]
MVFKASIRNSFPLLCFFAAIPLIIQANNVYSGEAGPRLSDDGIVEQRFVSIFVLAETGHSDLDSLYSHGNSNYSSELELSVLDESQTRQISTIQAHPDAKTPSAHWWEENDVISMHFLDHLEREEGYAPTPRSFSFEYLFSYRKSFKTGEVAPLDGYSDLRYCSGWQLSYHGDSDLQGGGCAICIFILSILIVFVSSSALLGIYLTVVALHSLGNSFTVAAYVLAVGAFAWSALTAWHTPRCRLRLMLGYQGHGRGQTTGEEDGRRRVEDVELERRADERSVGA